MPYTQKQSFHELFDMLMFLKLVMQHPKHVGVLQPPWSTGHVVMINNLRIFMNP